MLLKLVNFLRTLAAKLDDKATDRLFDGVRQQAKAFEATAQLQFARRDSHIHDAAYYVTASQDAETRALKAAGTAANLRKLLGE